MQWIDRVESTQLSVENVNMLPRQKKEPSTVKASSRISYHKRPLLAVAQWEIAKVSTAQQEHNAKITILIH